ncbi:NlpC/P60 family protein [Finegoldia magna SY403409CC001050417]|uniref:Cell wall-binding repeat-containing protein n=1 Tax=Finegoldia magna TaxID=1260 RepID=A0A7D4JD56_FINMA|nr:cell wall-binding repeat-containing protein [Finegoldia magna]EGS34552.1 NlpC/P60 family protein [Finegoldia magna SY403409CC001050417]QKH79519.1 cell wall-binding repeat-containing protein [Finegoldia magna]
MNNFKKPLLVMTLAVSLSLGANVSFADNENNKSETNVKAILDNSSKTETTKIQVKLDENNKVISNKNQNNKEEKKEAEVKSQKSAKTERIDAQNRFETAKKIKEKEFKNADTAVIVNSNEFSDSISATNISNGKSPILYTDSNKLDNLTKEALNGIKKVYITGGEKTISSKVVKELNGLGIEVIRVKGKDRYDVNAKSATTSHPVSNKKQNVVIASGENFADSISSTSLAKKKNAPVLLVKKNEVPKSIKEYLNSFRKKGLLGDITIVGGENSVSKIVENELSKLAKVTRIAGDDRYQTSVKVAKHVGVNSERTIVASGEKFVDVLAASPVAQKYNAPIVLVKKMDVPRNEDYKTNEQKSNSVESFFKQNKSKIMHTMVFGGKNTIDNFVVNGIKDLLAGKSLQAKPKVDALVNLPKKQEQQVQEETNKLDKIVELAYKQLGKPYVWGTHGPRSFDCSGLTSFLYKQAYGIGISTSSRAQASYGYKVSKSNLKKGDLMFFATGGGGISHVGIYVGNNKLIHASTPSTGVILSDINSSYYQRTFVTARRLLG